jgi:sulfide:quinone oxidoreductase
VAAPFGLGHAERIPLEKVAQDTGARWIRGTLASVDDAAATVRTAEGQEIGFDALLVTTGATPVEGVENATTWWPGGDQDVLSGLLRDLDEGYVERVAFVVPSGFVWPLPTYELALMTAREAAGMGQQGDEVTVVTPEREPLALFGTAASAALREELERAGIRLLTGSAAELRRTADGVEIRQAGGDGDPLVVQRAVAVPGSSGRACRACRPTRRASCSRARTAASKGSSGHGRPATASPRRSSSAGWPPGRRGGRPPPSRRSRVPRPRRPATMRPCSTAS